MPLDARLHITTALRQGRTTLKRAFCTQPFKIANITEDKSQEELQLMLMSSSPGILDGDSNDIRIDVAEGCQLQLETQSYQRLFRMKKGASQTMVVQLEKGSSFQYLPHPVVPHQQSHFRSQTKIFLSGGCTLVWGEVISCGRKLNGEVFQFTSLHSITEIFRDGKLVVKENLLLKPDVMSLTSIGHLEGHSHQATLLYLSEEATIPALVNELSGLMNKQPGIACGISALPVNGLVLRLLGHTAEQLFLLLKQAALILRSVKAISTKTVERYVA
jgi:urease accessory protein